MLYFFFNYIEWKADAKGYCDRFWPGWDNRIKENEESLRRIYKKTEVVVDGVGMHACIIESSLTKIIYAVNS